MQADVICVTIGPLQLQLIGTPLTLEQQIMQQCFLFIILCIQWISGSAK